MTETASWKCATESQRNEALTAVEFALRPAEADAIGAALYTLRIMTRGRPQVLEADREAEAMIWLEHLHRFPADIVLTTLRNWPTRPNGQWWPVWHEVQKDLEAQTSSRRVLAEHIRASKCLPAPVSADPGAERTAEQQARIDAQVERWRKAQGREHFKGETVVDRDAVPAAKLDLLDRAVEEAGAKLKAGDYRLSPEALATFNKDHLDSVSVDDPATQFDQWNKERAA